MAKTIGQLTQTTTIAGGDEFVIEQSGQTKRVAASVVRGGLLDAQIDAAAAIAYSKLAALDDGNILVGNGSNVATKVAVTGDVTISNAGVTAIGSAKVLPAMLSQPYTLDTAKASTSGTSIDFTDIPSWAKRITVMFNGVSTSATSSIQVQLGTGAGPTFTTSGYLGACGGIANASGAAVEQNGAGFRVTANISNTDIFHGNITICNITANTWAQQGILGQSTTRINWSGGSVALAAALTAVRITTVNGTDTFDAGSINISYEG